MDFEDAGANDWLAVNQFTVTENKHNRRADVVLFINGLPLAVLELKNAARERPRAAATQTVLEQAALLSGEWAAA